MKPFSNTNNVGMLIKIFPTFIFLVYTLFASTVEAEYKTPDFAYPKTAVSQSETALKNALDSGNQILALREALNICIATSVANEEETITANLSLLDSVGEKLTGQYRDLCLLAKADVLSLIYLGNSYQYNSRKLPLDEISDDPEEWSGEMFETTILDLVSEAIKNIEELPQTKIGEIGLLLQNVSESEKAGMSVAQFIALKGVSILQNFISDNVSTVIPFYPQKNTESIEGKCRAKTMELLDLAIGSLSEGNTVVKAIGVNKYLAILPDDQREGYLKENLKQLKGTEGEGLLLYYQWERYNPDTASIYKEMETWLAQYPDGFGHGNLKYAMARMSMKSIECELPKISLPNKSLEGKVSVSNLTKGYLLVFKLNNNQVSEYDELILKKFDGKSKPVEVIEITGEGEIPFSYDKPFAIPGLAEGIYTVIPSESKNLSRGWNNSALDHNYSVVRVSNIALLTTMCGNISGSGRVYVVDGENQQPVAGASVSYRSPNSKKAGGTSTTNDEGWVKIPDGYYLIEAVKGKSVAKGQGWFSYSEERSNISRHTTILTDLAVYRPGDTISFAVIGWNQEKYANSILKNCKVKIELRDANYMKAGETILELNEDGRATGKLKIPEGKLLGNYNLQSSFPDFSEEYGGAVSVRVEEYKVPSFRVTIHQEDTDLPDVIKFRGQALTFSGMPIADGKVNFTVSYVPWRWGFIGSNATYHENAVTDSEGYFSLELPFYNLKGSMFANGRYSISAEVTSESDETESSSTLFFYAGNHQDIRPNIPDKYQAEGDTVKFNVPVYDIAGLPVKTKLDYRITNINDSSISMSGWFESPSLCLDSKTLISGKYKLEFKPVNGEGWTSTETVIWRNNDERVPYPTSLWIPKTEFTFSPTENKVEVSFGSYWDNWILYILSDGENVLETEWISPYTGMNKKEISIPQNSQEVFLTLCGLHDFKSETGLITLRSTKTLEQLDVKAISYRENISAGNKEDWTFQFSIDGNEAPFVNALAVMTDKALNSISDFNWNLNIWKTGHYSKIRLNPERFSTALSYRNFTLLRGYKFSNYSLPEWECYGYSLIPRYGFGRMGAVAYKTMAVRNAMADFDSTAGVTEEAADDSVMETPQKEDSGIELAEETQLRPIEMPVALFMPDLKSDKEGNLSLKFTVPDFNTTWQFQLAGYNEKMLNTTLKFDAVAAKSVMAKSNLPQYLRTGDKAEISATLYNNTDSVAPVSGRIEIIDPYSGKVLAEKEYPAENISAYGSRVINIRYDVSNEFNLITVRSYAAGENHMDGEQGFIPVLPSSTPVVESTPFYISSTQKEFEMKIPSAGKNSNVTLKYCDNPLWEALLSLPALKEGTNGGALALSQWIYSTLTSQTILRNNPDIASQLSQIIQSDDSTLTMSNLEKDIDLKIADLEATPWINNARSETERIRGLKQYLDKEPVETNVRLKIEALGKLQNKDGGFSWFDGMKSSPFITSRIIQWFGCLENIGASKPELESLSRKAVNYYDKYLTDQWNNNKYHNVSAAINYLYSRNKLGYKASPQIKKIEGECIDSIRSGWKHWNIEQKTLGALIMSHYEKYKQDVMDIVASLQQISLRKSSLQEDVLILDLLDQTGASESFAESIREAVLLKKETVDWSDSPYAPLLVHALISSETGNNIVRSLPVITIDGQPLSLKDSQALTGNFTLDLSSKDIAGKTLCIQHQEGLPAWGGIITQKILPIPEVKSHKTDKISIEKKVYKDMGDGKVKEVAKLEKGDKVTVSLSLNCSQEMDYVVLVDSGSACLQPADKLSGPAAIDGIYAYREMGSSKTSFFIEQLPAGKYVISYDCYVEREGVYSIGIAEIQSLYSPLQTANSSGKILQSE